MEQTLKKLVIVLAVLGLVGFALNLLVDNPYTHRLIRAAINEKVVESTNLSVDFKAIKVSLAPPGVDLYGFHLATNVKPDEPLVTASHAKARLSLWSLFLGEIRLGLVETNDLTVVWPPPWGFEGFLKDAKPAPSKPGGPITWPPAFDLPINNIVLKNTRLYLELPLTEKVPEAASYFVTSLVGLDVDVELDGWKDVEVSLSVQSANAAARGSSIIEETAVEATVELIGGKINASRLKVAGERIGFDGTLAGALETSGKGKTPPLDAVQITAEGDVRGDLSLLGSILDLPNTRGGVVGKADVMARIPVEAAGEPTFVVKADAQVQDGYLDGFRLFNSKAKLEVLPEGLKLTDVDIVVEETTVGKAQGEIRFEPLTFDFTAVPDGLRLLDLLDAVRVSFDDFDAGIASPNLRVFGRGEPFKLEVEATAQFSDMTLPNVAFDQSKFPVSPACRLDFHLVVQSDHLSFDRTKGLCFQPDAGAGAPKMPVAGETSAPPRATAVSELAVDGPIRFDHGIDLRVAASSVDLALGQFFAQIPLAGSGRVDTRIHGPFDKVVIENALALQDVAVARIPLGAVTGKVSYSERQVTWRDVVADVEGEGRITAESGSLRIDDELRIKAHVTAAGLTAGKVAEMIAGVAPDVKLGIGVESIDAQIEGPLLHPFAYRGKVAVTVGPVVYAGETLADEATATLVSGEKGWSTDDLDVRLGDLSLGVQLTHQRAFPFSFAEAQGSDDPWVRIGLHPDDKLDVTFATHETKGPNGEVNPAADHLGVLPFAGAKLKEANIAGQIQVAGKMTGATGDLQGTFEGSINRPTVFGSLLAPLNFKGFVKNGQLDVVLNHSGNSLEGRLSLDVMKPGVPYEWFFNFNRMDLRAFGTEMFHADPRNYLYLSANWHMQGQFTDWWRSTGELDIKDIRAKYTQDIAAQTKTLQIRQEQPVRLKFSKDGWAFEEDQDLYLSGRHVQLRVSMQDNKPPERLGIKLESIVDMAILKEFSQAIDTATGKIRAVAEVKGSVENPDLSFEVTDLKQNPFIAATWTPVTLGLADIRPAFRNVRLRILYRDGRLVIDKFAADKGAGTITATGSLNLAGRPDEGAETRLDVTMNDATVIYPVAFLKSFEAQVSGNFALSGRGVPYRLTGDLAIARARSTSEVDIRDEIINALRRQTFKTSTAAETPTLLLDLNVTADQSINIHNRNLQAVLSTDLQIKGTDIAPSVQGQVEIDKGKFTYKQDFELTRGLVTFDDPIKPDPSLDILAASEVDSYRVYIAISGRASNPTVEFAVDPPTREDGSPISKVEILVLLSRGKLPEANKSIGQTTGGAATSEAINLIMGQFEEPVEKLFDLSGQSVVRNVYIDTHPSPKGDPVPRLNLPLELGDDLDAVVRFDQSTNEAGLEYHLHENIDVTGTVEQRRPEESGGGQQEVGTNKGDAKVNMKFRFSFE